MHGLCPRTGAYLTDGVVVRKILAHLGLSTEPPPLAPARVLEERDLRRFVGLVDGPATYPASRPRRRIDHVLALADWTLVEQNVTAIGWSDHLAVIATFRKP